MNENTTIDINKLFNIYIEENLGLELRKRNKLEHFRVVENDLKKYIYALGELEKLKNESYVYKYKNIYSSMMARLSVFDPLNLEKNIAPIKEEMDEIEEMKGDLKNIYLKMQTIDKIWDSFLNRNKDIDMSSIFIENITDKISYLHNLFDTISFDEISRIEEELGDLKRDIERSISMIEELKDTLNRFDFIGKEPAILRKDIIQFVDHEYKTLNLIQLNEKYSNLESRIKELKSLTRFKREKVKVIKISNKEHPDIYNYGIEMYGVFMNLSDMDGASTVKVDTHEYIYLDGFPHYGLFEQEKMKDRLELTDDQFFAIEEFEKHTFKIFLMFLFGSIFIISMTLTGILTPFMTIPLVAANAFLFIIVFKGLKFRNNSKYKLENMFYFFKISYRIVSEGDSTFRFQTVIPNILINLEKIINRRDSNGK